MNILFAGHKERGLACLQALIHAGHTVLGVVVQTPGESPLTKAAKEAHVPVYQPGTINDSKVIAELKALKADLFVLAGYGPILRQEALRIPTGRTINLHAGKLPEYQGSSPLNWVLINGESSFTLSVIEIDAGVDTGPVLAERTFPIGGDDTIADLHRVANDTFPQLLLQVIQSIEQKTLKPRRQEMSEAAYYPLRFPEDGLILWDRFTALQMHNRIRALTDPYPGAYTFFQNKRIQLLRSRLTEKPFYGEPGRVYQINDKGVLVCASDRCLWIEKAAQMSTGLPLKEMVKRYDRLSTSFDSYLAMAAKDPA